MHTLNLERLARVVMIGVADGLPAVFPETLVGTDSHTSMVSGLGVLAWGVGGLEAESVLFDIPIMLRVPDVVGVRLSGELPPGATATDLALVVTEKLRAARVAGQFVEFFGPGVSTLSAGQRCVVANMAPEFGAWTALFPIDERTLEYLRRTGRSESHLTVVENYARRVGLWFDPASTPRYARIVEIDLAAISMSLAGPRRPEDRLTPDQVPHAIPRAQRQSEGDRRPSVPDGAVAIAAITSCTNTSDPQQVVAAALVARRARQLGVKPPWWVKTSFAPGSPSAALYLQRAGLLADLEAIGFAIVGYGCTTCIGNSGPLVQGMAEAIARAESVPVAVLSGNRNFPGRIHRDIAAALLSSPALVVAYALAGHARLNIAEDVITHAATGAPVRLLDLWPTEAEVEAVMAGLQSSDVSSAYEVAEAHQEWASLESASGDLFPWEPGSTYLRRPPFASAVGRRPRAQFSARPLLVLGDDVTTDHISPAGSIDARSDAGLHLLSHGADPHDLNVYSSRRGNWEVMIRGLFSNRTAVNLLEPGLPAAMTIHAGSGDRLPLWEAAQRYHDSGTPLVIVAGHRYGAGSSRDWAAKGVALLGVAAVLAVSFERIHRSNLIGMGVMPIRIPEELHPSMSRLTTLDLVQVNVHEFRPAGRVTVSIARSGDGTEAFCASLDVQTELEIQLLEAGGMIPFILHQVLAQNPTASPSAVNE
jgi:aconitate hydratase